MTEKQKSEGMLSFLMSILGSDGLKDLKLLSESVKSLSDELIILAKSVSKISKILEEHSIAINELYVVQSAIIQQMSQNVEVDHIAPKDRKNKLEKPN